MTGDIAVDGWWIGPLRGFAYLALDLLLKGSAPKHVVEEPHNQHDEEDRQRGPQEGAADQEQEEKKPPAEQNGESHENKILAPSA